MIGARLRVLLADDHDLVRDGLVALLTGEADIEVVGQARDGEEAVRLAEDKGPDVVLMDIGLPRLNGIDATERIRRSRPGISVIMLSMHDDGPTVDRALRAGARGYVIKGSGFASLREAISTVARGEVYLSPGISGHVLHSDLSGSSPDASLLSTRQSEILQLVAEGHTSREIAELLGLSPKTVENHRARIMDKLDIHTVAGLVRYALKTGLAR